MSSISSWFRGLPWLFLGPVLSVLIWLLAIDHTRWAYPWVFVNREFGVLAWLPVTCACAALLFRRSSPVWVTCSVLVCMGALVFFSYFAYGLIFAACVGLSAVLRRRDVVTAVGMTAVTTGTLLLFGVWQDFYEYSGSVLAGLLIAAFAGLGARVWDRRGPRRI